MSLRGLLAGSVPRVAITVLVALGVLVGGGFAAGVFGIPGVAAVDNAFGSVNDTATTIETDLVVHNPNPVGASFDDSSVEYRIRMNDVPMAHGTKSGIAIGAGNTSVPLETTLRNEQIPAWWVSHLQNGERTAMTITADVYSGTLDRSRTFTHQPDPIETDIAAQFDTDETRPIDAGLPLISDPVLYLNSTRGDWGDVTTEETPIEMEFTLHNPKDTPVTMTRLGYDITMNDVTVGDGTTDRSVTIPPHSTRTVSATTVIRNAKLDEWWVTHLERNQVTEMELAFYARIDVGGESVRVPLRNVSHTIETDMFGTKPTTDGTDGNADSSDDSSGSTTTDTATTTTTTTTTDSTTTTTTTTDSTTTTTTTTDSTTTTTTTEDDGLLG